MAVERTLAVSLRRRRDDRTCHRNGRLLSAERHIVRRIQPSDYTPSFRACRYPLIELAGEEERRRLSNPYKGTLPVQGVCSSFITRLSQPKHRSSVDPVKIGKRVPVGNPSVGARSHLALQTPRLSLTLTWIESFLFRAKSGNGQQRRSRDNIALLSRQSGRKTRPGNRGFIRSSVRV